ncbi:MAG: hypothetical protein PHY72_00780 [Candidatus Pacebacteria bacterium]|nr:hypothetical protein [Candidatus Paceibacterota bacterium]
MGLRVGHRIKIKPGTYPQKAKRGEQLPSVQVKEVGSRVKLLEISSSLVIVQYGTLILVVPVNKIEEDEEEK